MLPCAASYRIGTGSLRPGAESDSESESAGAVPAPGWALAVRFSSDPASLRNVELFSNGAQVKFNRIPVTGTSLQLDAEVRNRDRDRDRDS